MFDCPEHTHTSPTRTFLIWRFCDLEIRSSGGCVNWVLFDVEIVEETQISRGDDDAFMGSKSNFQQPSASAVADCV